ncbi:MAG: hypothetical protein K0R58_797 [Ramlibacter sp.]|jgi:hypothetical protein|nr:hypothetical protein [Ramlibacter sp.]
MRARKLALWGSVAVFSGALAWGSVRYFDGTQAAAREYIAKEAAIVGRIGPVEDVALYKLRYMDPQGTADGCFAEYSFFVSGAGGNSHVRALACGSRAAPEFKIREG